MEDFIDPLGVLGGPPPTAAAPAPTLPAARAPAPSEAKPSAVTGGAVSKLATSHVEYDPLGSDVMAASSVAPRSGVADADSSSSSAGKSTGWSSTSLGATPLGFGGAAGAPAVRAVPPSAGAGSAIGPSKLTMTVVVTGGGSGASEVANPLTGGAGSGGAAAAPLPLLPGGSGSSGGLRSHGSAASSGSHSPYLDWSVRRAAILREYTVSGKMALTASYMAEDADEAGGEETSVPLAKARQRLEQLEAAARGAHTVEMSQGEYVRRIERLHRALQNAWDSNHRVAALKIAIQCAKLLGEHRVPQFYPSMFVMVTEILDTFGRLVFDRLKVIADEEYRRLGNKGSLPDAFIAADVGGEARETTRNWMYKTACIRELLPRLYVEMALLEAYRYIYDADFAAILLRLVHSIRGVGNPLVAAYARLYLARMAAKLVRDDNRQRESMLVAVSDFMSTFPSVVTAPARLAQMESHGLSPAVYLHLYQPALAWQMHQLGWGAGRDVFAHVLGLYREHVGHASVLQAIIDAFDPAFFAPHAEALVGLIKDAAPSPLASQADLFRSLATQLLAAHPPEAARPALLTEAWAALTAVTDPVAYARNAAALLDLLLACYSEAEVLVLMRALVARMQRSAIATGATVLAAAPGGGAAGAGAAKGAPEEAGGKGAEEEGAAAAAAAAASLSPSRRGGVATYSAPAGALPHLERVLTSLVEAEVRKATTTAAAAAAAGAPGGGGGGSRFSGVITSEHFTALLDMFAGEHKPALCKALLGALTSVPGCIADPVVVNTMQEVARTCHDALDVLSSDDETRTATALISAFVGKIDLGRDLERQLELYVDCRRAFPNLDGVKATLCACGTELALKALRLVRGRHNPRTAAFVKSALAFVTITVPGIDDPFTRMRLYLAAAGAALANACVGQADMLFRSVITEVPELPASLAVAASLASATPAAVSGSAPSAATATSTATDARLLEVVRDFCRGAVPMPGHPEQGGLYLARGLLNAVQRYPWQHATLSPHRWQALGAALGLVHALCQAPLPARVPGLESNDVLYAGDPAYMEEARALMAAALQTIVAGIEELQASATSGADPRSREVLLSALPALLRERAAQVLDVDTGAAATGALEKLCLCLRSVDASHPALQDTIALVTKRLRQQQAKA